MTYLQILRLLERYAWNQPDVHSVVREFTDLNREEAQYSAVVIQDRDGERDLISDQDWITYTWHIGYVDRLWEEKNDNNNGYREMDGFGNYTFYSNRDDIYSQGVRVINNIIAGLRKDYDLEITTPDRINTFNQRFTAECAGVYMVIAVTVPVSDCETGGVEDMYDTLSQRFTTNGTYHFVPEGKPWDQADIVIDVHPQESLVTNFTENGIYDLEGEWKDARIGVNVHPSTSLSASYTENGTYNIDGEFNGGQVTVAVSSQKPEESLVETITSNGSYSYSPQQGYVYDSVSLSVDVHPSTSLSETYTSNGTYSIDGEFNGGEVTVSVPQVSQTPIEINISENGVTGYSPLSGYAFNFVSIYTNVHPHNILSETYTENGTYNISGEFAGGQVTVAVSSQKPEESLVETITSNGSYSYSPQQGYVYDGVSLSVDVHPSQRLTRTYTTNGSKDLTGEWKDGTININVHPSTSLSETYTSNGTYSISGEFDGGQVIVSVPDYYEQTVEYLFGNCGSVSKIFYYDGSDGGDYTDIISALPSGWTSENLEGADSVLYYTSSSGQVVDLEDSSNVFFDKDVVSNTYSDGVGAVLFDGPLKYNINFGYNSIFKNSADITSVTIPSSVERLGERSFYECTGLTSVSFESPSSLEVIGDAAFIRCSNLNSISIPSSVRVLGTAFQFCSGLTSIAIPSSVEEIDSQCFENCTGLTSVSFESPSSVNILRTGTFRNTGLTSITIPASVDEIGVQCFMSCSNLSSVSFESPSSLMVIKDGAFHNCNISSITIPSSVETIEDDAFNSCELRSLTIPSSVTNIGKGIAHFNSFLDHITVDAGNQVYDSRNGCEAIIETSSNVLVQGCNNTVIPDGVVSIDDYAFSGIYILNINIPSSVTNIGSYAFSSSKLTSVTIPSSVTNIGSYAFYFSSRLEEVIVNCTIPPSLGGNAFYAVSSSLQIKVPASSLQDYLNAPGWSNYASKIVAQ